MYEYLDANADNEHKTMVSIDDYLPSFWRHF